MATSVGDLLLRARLELGGFQRDLTRMQSMAAGVAQNIRGPQVQVDTSGAQQQGKELAQQLAFGFESDRQRVKRAIQSTVADAVRSAPAAAPPNAGASASIQATEALRQANEAAADAIRDRASAQREAAAAGTSASTPAAQAAEQLRTANEGATQALREQAAAQQQVAASGAANNSAVLAAADSYRQWATSSRQASQSVADISADITSVSAAFRAGEASLDDYAAAIEHARRQADLLGVAGGGKLGRQISSAEMALIAAREEADKLAASTSRAMSGSAAASKPGNIFVRLKEFDKDVRKSTGGVGRLNNAFVTLTQQMAGANPVVGRIVDALGTFAIGSAAMVGVLAGLTAVAAVVSRMTRGWREARKEMEQARDRLKEIARIRALPEGGQTQADVKQAVEQLESLRSQLATLRAAENVPGQGFEAAASTTMRVQATRKEIEAVLAEIRAGEATLVEARTEANRRMRAAEASNLATIVASGEATAGELARANQRIVEEQERLAALARTTWPTRSPETDDQREQRAQSISAVEQLRGALERLGDMQRQQAEEAARALQEEVAALASARQLGVLRTADLGRALALEQRFRREVEAGTGSLEQRVEAAQQLSQLAAFSLDRDAELAVPQVSAIIAGVEIDNPDEVKRAYQEQVRQTLEDERVRMNMVLTPVVDRGGGIDEAERRRIAVQAAEESTRAFNESIQAGTEVISAFGDLADAADRLGAGLGGFLRAVETASGGAMRFRFGRALQEHADSATAAAESMAESAKTATETAAAADAMASAVSLQNQAYLAQLSGLVSIGAGVVSVFFDILNRDSEIQRAHSEAVRQATEAVDRFKLELSGFRPDTAAGREGVAEAIRALTESDAGRGLRDSLEWRDREIDGLPVTVRVSPAEQRVLLDEMLRGVGSSLEQVLSIAESIGLEIFDSGGRFVIENFMALAETIGLANQAMVGFANTLTDLQQERDLRDRILGVERTPEQGRAALFGDLRTLAPELFQEFFTGVNLADVEATRQATLRLFDSFAAGGEEFAAMMGNLTRDEFLQWLGQTADSLKTLDETTKSVTGALTNVPQGFRILNLELERFNAMQRQRVADLAQPPATVAPPPAATPPPAAQPERPTHRPPQGPVEAPGRDRPTYEIADHRTYSIQVVQQDGEDGEAFASRVVEIVRRMDREAELTFTGSVGSAPFSRR